MDERRVLRFKDFMLQEGEVWDALRHGVSTGVKAYKQKRADQKKQSEADKLSQKILSAEGKDLEQLVRQIVRQGYTLRNGKVVKPSKVKYMSQEVLECTTTRMGFV